MRKRRAPERFHVPSTFGYMTAAGVFSLLLFMGLVWLLKTSGDDAPWLPAGLAAGLLMLGAFAAREIFVRRAWARYTHQLELEMGIEASREMRPYAGRSARGDLRAAAAALRALQQHLAETEVHGASPEAHLEAYRLCERYMADTDEAMRANHTALDVRVALRAGQERVKELQKHHLLAWTRGEATRLTDEAQRRVRVSDKIETAQRAVDVIDEALRLYPSELELRASATAVRDFMASARVAHWVELAERAAFRGLHARAIARYQDALFYLSRADMGEEARGDAAGKIRREIDLLRAHVAPSKVRAKKESPGFSSTSAAAESEASETRADEATSRRVIEDESVRGNR